MAKKVKKAPKAVSANPQDSMIIQAGVLFVVVAAIAVTAYVFANYYPVAGAGM